MTKKKTCVVVIPLYKNNPERSERESFRQTLHVLKNYDICIVTHSKCCLDEYIAIAEKEGKNIYTELFNTHFFESIDGYNELCFSSEFYERFLHYEYMLICQLDVWIFEDQLDYWCGKGYDYIGAPLFHAYTKERYTKKILGIGNGGFSLRKISHCLKITRHNRSLPLVKPIEIIRFYWNLGKYTEDFTLHPIRRLGIIPTVILKSFGIGNTLNYYISHHANEDLIFGKWSNHSWGLHSHLPSIEEASHFAFEVHPSMLYQKTGKLPFGCHAFLKWEYEEFWKKHISLKDNQQ